MKKLFVLSYKGATSFVEKFRTIHSIKNSDVHIVDNGGQQWTIYKDNVVHTTQTNIGCAGGWNLCCDIGFNGMNQDIIVISNDDNFFSDLMVDTLYDAVLKDPNSIVGAYDRSFEFSLFAIHRSTFEKIGRFDENFLYVTCEDDDYKYRASLNGVKISSLMAGADSNLSLSSGELTKDQRAANIDYIKAKWGEPRSYTTPFNNNNIVPRSEPLKNLYQSTYGIHWPSQAEFIRYQTENK